MSELSSTPDAIVAEFLRVTQDRIERSQTTGGGAGTWDDSAVIVGSFTVAYLMEMLRRVDPAVADFAAQDLTDLWDDGAAIGEWTWEFRDDLANDRPLDPRGLIFDRVIKEARHG